MVFKKKRPSGMLSECWYYEFTIQGKRYRGSTFKSSKAEAIEFESNIKAEIKQMIDKNSVSKTKKDSLMRFREKITSEVQGVSIRLDDIWETFRKEAPAKMRRIPGEKVWAEKASYLKDFLTFIKEKHPDCKTMRDVTTAMAEQYVGLLKTSGRYCKKIECKGTTYQNNNTQLSASSINEYITQIKQVFRILHKSAGLIENPFDDIQKLRRQSKKRDVFDIPELEKIDLYIKDLKQCKSLTKTETLTLKINEAIFVIGINTGLRRGDISLLKWNDVNFDSKVITRELLKTKEEVYMPMSLRLYEFLREKEKNRINEYVTPELAEMYLSNSDGISYRFKKMLKELNIESQKSHKERSRKTSNKDIHSLRHTFCYLHGMQGTRIIVLQSMVGHMDKKMTESYMMHQTEQLKREAIDKFSLQAFQPQSLQTISDTKQEVFNLLKQCQDENILEQIKETFQLNCNNHRSSISGPTL